MKVSSCWAYFSDHSTVNLAIGKCYNCLISSELNHLEAFPLDSSSSSLVRNHDRWHDEGETFHNQYNGGCWPTLILIIVYLLHIVGGFWCVIEAQLEIPMTFFWERGQNLNDMPHTRRDGQSRETGSSLIWHGLLLQGDQTRRALVVC